jgi:hypothetical protein
MDYNTMVRNELMRLWKQRSPKLNAIEVLIFGKDEVSEDFEKLHRQLVEMLEMLHPLSVEALRIRPIHHGTRWHFTIYFMDFHYVEKLNLYGGVWENSANEVEICVKGKPVYIEVSSVVLFDESNKTKTSWGLAQLIKRTYIETTNPEDQKVLRLIL